MGSSSAVGVASRNDSRTPRLYSVLAKRRKPDRSFLEIPPIGFMSADEQSYLVRYPRRHSSTLADPSTCTILVKSPLIEDQTQALRKFQRATAQEAYKQIPTAFAIPNNSQSAGK